MSDNPSIRLSTRYGADNYHPLPIVITRGEGVWVEDPQGQRYMDMLSSYSALNQGHCHPRILAALVEQARQLTLTSRAFHNDRMGTFLEKLCKLSGFPKALPMNTGAEAVETGIKAVRKWGYQVKGVPPDKAEIIVCADNFHGRTTTIVGFSTEEQYKKGFGPFTPGFRVVPFGDTAALAAAFTPNTVAFLVEPIQGEAGIHVPPPGYLAEARRLCDAHGVVLIFDEVVTGFRLSIAGAQGRYGVVPDMATFAKAMSSGYPFGAVVGKKEVMSRCNDMFVSAPARWCSRPCAICAGTTSNRSVGSTASNEATRISTRCWRMNRRMAASRSPLYR